MTDRLTTLVRASGVIARSLPRRHGSSRATILQATKSCDRAILNFSGARVKSIPVGFLSAVKSVIRVGSKRT